MQKHFFDFDCLEFTNDSITSVLAKLIYDWIMTLNKQEISEKEKLNLLKEFIDQLAPIDHSVRELLNNKNTKKECIVLLQELERAIASIKEATMFFVLWNFLKVKINIYNPTIQLKISLMN